MDNFYPGMCSIFKNPFRETRLTLWLATICVRYKQQRLWNAILFAVTQFGAGRIARRFKPYFTFIPGLVTIFTSNRLKKEMISKIKNATKKNNRSNKQTRNTNAYVERLVWVEIG